MSGHKKDEVTGGTKKLCIKWLHNFCPTPTIFRIIISEKVRFKRNAVWMMMEMRNVYNILAVKLKENATYET